jgi:SAM-dependent methyltransferase
MNEGDASTMFERPALWRTEAVLELADTREERQAAASPGPAFPQALGLVERAVSGAPAGPVIDVGAGLAGITDWLSDQTSRDVLPIDASHESCIGAVRIFPQLTPIRANVVALPLRPRSVAAVVMAGVLSLLDDHSHVACIEEAARCLRPDGLLAVVDLISSTSQDVRCEPNFFRSAESLGRGFVRAGFDPLEQAIAEPEVGWWTDFDGRMLEHIRLHHDDVSAYRGWLHDQNHLRTMMGSGGVLVGAMTFIRGA